ncbi:MAG TPA: NAD-dependent epimerase/dehydratase family protein [Longimicrobiales bacterium]|nr:NAD-dependent epimerase/dehydratase family protein [Longimicrobiales bacterium]
MTTRRAFLQNSAAAAVSLSLAGRARAAVVRTTPPSRRIRLLILGGTGFIGPHQVRYAVERGHDVAIFNRGRSAPGMFTGVEELIGDRAANQYDALKGRTWDVVIDNSASAGPTAPQWVREAGAVLKDNVAQYIFISTRSVFRDLSMVPATVDAPLYTTETTPNWQPGQPYPYGLGKALAEAEARAAFGDRTTIVRPGLIVGPGDDTDRFTYWPARIHRGGEVLAPGDRDNDRVQVIDVRDLCDWAVRLGEDRTFGTFMAVGPENGRSMAEMLYGIAAVTSAPLTWTWVPLEFLAQHRVRPYAEMPVWRPPTPGFEGFARFDLSREVAAGLTFRTLADTASATLEYHLGRPTERQEALRAGLTPAREAEVLAARAASRGPRTESFHHRGHRGHRDVDSAGVAAVPAFFSVSTENGCRRGRDFRRYSISVPSVPSVVKWPF